jgi:hypothetical protein
MLRFEFALLGFETLATQINSTNHLFEFALLGFETYSKLEVYHLGILI